MACALTQGFSRDCKDELGGITDIVIGAFSTVAATGLVYDGTTGEVEDLPTGITLYRYEVDDMNTSFTDPLTAEENGAAKWAPEITTQLRKIDSNKRKELQLLAKNRVVVFLVPHRSSGFDKKIYCFGLYRGLQLTAGGFEHGAGMGDFSGLKLTFSGEQAEPMRLVEAYTSVPFDNALFSLTISPAFPAVGY
jgi:hypothetical protein